MRAVNLIPDDQRGNVSAAGRSGGGAYAVLVVLGGLALLALLYGLASHEISSSRSKAATLAARAARAEALASQLAPYTSFVAAREAREQAVSTLMDTRFDWSHSLREIGRVLPMDASITSLSGTVGSSSAAAQAKPATSSSVASATPAGTVPTFTINGCATSQAEVALVLQRLRLIDGVSEVKLSSSSKSDAGSSGASSGGGCVAHDPAYVLTVSFDALPTPSAPAAPLTTLASNSEGAGGGGSTGGLR